VRTNVRRRRGAGLAALSVFVSAAVAACSTTDQATSIAASSPLLVAPVESLPLTLASAPAYRVDTSSPRVVGRIVGSVQYDGTLPPDTLVRPTHDLGICRAIPDGPIVGTAAGVGDAVVWLVGVTSGPPDDAPRRVQLSLEGCAIKPRVQRAPVGATLLVRSGDAMDVRLRFLDIKTDLTTLPAATPDSSRPVTPPPPPRALVPLGNAGAVVPLTSILQTPGLVEVRDDRHPWIKGWIAVAPNPYLVITDGNGQFALEDVPPGSYVLVTWHERLGRLATPVHVDAGIETRVRVLLPAR